MNVKHSKSTKTLTVPNLKMAVCSTEETETDREVLAQKVQKVPHTSEMDKSDN